MLRVFAITELNLVELHHLKMLYVLYHVINFLFRYISSPIVVCALIIIAILLLLLLLLLLIIIIIIIIIIFLHAQASLG